MAEAILLKVSSEIFSPMTDEDKDALSHIKIGEGLRCKFSRVRNIKFHKKYFALLNLAYDQWQPGEVELKDKRFVPEKNFETFRKNIAVMAGYYFTSFTIAGEPRIEAKSISFSSMSEEEFSKLYSATVDVVLKHILKNYTGDDLENAVMNVMGFV